MNRRDLFKALAAGATVVAGELWIPGQKLISIPSGKIFTRGPKILVRGYRNGDVFEHVMDIPRTARNDVIQAAALELPKGMFTQLLSAVAFDLMPGVHVCTSIVGDRVNYASWARNQKKSAGHLVSVLEEAVNRQALLVPNLLKISS